MKITIRLLVPVLPALLIAGCGLAKKNNKTTQDPAETTADTIAEPASEAIDERRVVIADDPFQAIIDSLRAFDDVGRRSSYALYDVTGDGEPELWVMTGTCEADMGIDGYLVSGNRAELIMHGGAGHAYFRWKGGHLISSSAHCGEEALIVYRYQDGRMHATDTIVLSHFTEDGIPKVVEGDESVYDYWNSVVSDPVKWIEIKHH